MGNFKQKRGPAKGGALRRFGRGRSKVCYYCAEKVDEVDYKNIDLLKRYINEKGKIMPRRATGNCACHQRMVAAAIKRSRQAVLLPFVSE